MKINFPLGVSSQNGYDFNSPEKHSTIIISENDKSVLFERKQDNDIYYAKVQKGQCKSDREREAFVLS